MRPTAAARDIRGRRVRLGACVRVLKIAPWLMARLDAPSKQCVRSMIGETFKVDDIDSCGHPWVTKVFGGNIVHGLALDAGEMELILPRKRAKTKAVSCRRRARLNVKPAPREPTFPHY